MSSRVYLAACRICSRASLLRARSSQECLESHATTCRVPHDCLTLVMLTTLGLSSKLLAVMCIDTEHLHSPTPLSTGRSAACSTSEGCRDDDICFENAGISQVFQNRVSNDQISCTEWSCGVYSSIVSDLKRGTRWVSC